MSDDCLGCTIGDDDTGGCTGGTSFAGTPISDGLAPSLSVIELLRMPVSEVLRLPSTGELPRWLNLVSLYSFDQTWKDPH